MCPACIATAALVVAGGGSVGGLTAFAIKKFRKNKTERKTHIQNKSKQNKKEK